MLNSIEQMTQWFWNLNFYCTLVMVGGKNKKII